MSEEKKERWLNYLALTTVIFAVCATLSTFKGGGHSTKAVLSQTMASDQWAYYQSKSIKGYLYELQKEALDLELKAQGPKVSPTMKDEFAKKITSYGEKIKKYEGEKEKIQAEAKAFEERRDTAQKHQQAFGVAVIFLQIAILLSSVAALLKKKPLWFVSLGAGVAGLFYFANGFLLFIK
ncbi:MAG: DUF4337 domain-containing protein [Nitrospirae bacterium]|nr:DUF4337 domain-containing protein [Nitrospirota bacterium]